MKIEKMKNNNLTFIILAILLLLGLYFRIDGLNQNYSFWTDENHVAIFVRAILERGEPVLDNGYSSGAYQWLLYWISAISAKIFGINEFAIRLPSVFFGVSTILAIYLLGKKIFDLKIGLLSAFFATFLNIEILFSRQARPYQALQFFYLLGFYFIYRLVKEKKFSWQYFLGFLGCGILASLMHGLGIVIFFTGFIYLLIFKASYFMKRWMLLGISLFVLLGFIFKVPIISVFSQIGKTDNLFYYRVFLTHNYLPLCFLSTTGGLFLFWQKKYQQLIVFIIVFLVQLIIVSYFLPQPFTRYFYPIFGFLIILASYGIMDIGKWILEIGNRIPDIGYKQSLMLRNRKLDKSKNTSIQYLISSIIFFVVVFSLWKTDKLSLFPKNIYSLNADMQEIPEVDWKKVYGLIENKLNQNPRSVLVTNWSDLPVWYLGEGKLNYMVRKVNTVAVDSFSDAKIINNLESFEKIIKEYPKGLLILDSWDDQVPDGIREFSRDNLKKELEIDRLYPIQPRLWPVSVFSW